MWFEIFLFSHQVTSPVIDVIKNISVQSQWVSWFHQVINYLHPNEMKGSCKARS